MDKTTRVKQSRSKYSGPGDRFTHMQPTERTTPEDNGFGAMLTAERENFMSWYGGESRQPLPGNPTGGQGTFASSGNHRQTAPGPSGYSSQFRQRDNRQTAPGSSRYSSQSGQRDNRRAAPEPSGYSSQSGQRDGRQTAPGPSGYSSQSRQENGRQVPQGLGDRKQLSQPMNHRQFPSEPAGSQQLSKQRTYRQPLSEPLPLSGHNLTTMDEGQSGRERGGWQTGKAMNDSQPAKTRKGQSDTPELAKQRRQASSPVNRQISETDRQPARKKAGPNFIVQGSILAVAGIIVRLIGMLYRIPLANYIGDEGNGYYSAAYNIYSILLILSSYSMPVAVSKMVSARLAKKQNRNALRILKAALFYATIAGGLGFCALWFGADFFAAQIIKMPFSAYALRVLAPTIWIMAYLGVLRGFFQGHATMVPTAVSQVFEQIVNAVVSLLAAKTLFNIGLESNLVYGSTEYSYAFGAAGGALGTGAGALTALLMFVGFLFLYLPAMRRKARRESPGQAESYGTITSILVFTVVPIIISSTLYNSSTVIDNTLFGQVMSTLGKEDEIASQWGIYSGKYHLLFNIPVAVANSLSSSLIPSLSRAVAQRNRKQIVEKISNAIRFSMIIAIPSAVGLTVLAAPVCNLLFSGGDNEMLIRMTLLGSSAVVVYSLSTVTNAVLQGINKMKVPIQNAAVSMVLHSIILYVMLRVLRLGIYGVLYSNILFALFICVLNARAISRYKRYRQEVVKTFLIPLACSAVMGAGAYGTYQLCSLKLGNLISTLFSILVAVMIYFVLLIKWRGIDAGEMKHFPGGTRLLSVARKLHLM